MLQGRMIILGEGDRPQTVFHNTTLKIAKDGKSLPLCTFNIGQNNEVKIKVNEHIKRRVAHDGKSFPTGVIIELRDSEVLFLDEYKIKLLPLDNSGDHINWKIYEMADVSQDVEVSIEQVLVDQVFEDEGGAEEFKVERTGTEIKIPDPVSKKEATRTNIRLTDITSTQSMPVEKATIASTNLTNTLHQSRPSATSEHKLTAKNPSPKIQINDKTRTIVRSGISKERTKTGIQISNKANNQLKKKAGKVKRENSSKVKNKNSSKKSNTPLLMMALFVLFILVAQQGYLDSYLSLVPGLNDFFGK